MQSLNETTILITGATDGLGRRVAQDLATQGATVLLHGRSKDRAKKMLREIGEQTGNKRLSYYLADYASLEDVQDLARKVWCDQERIDVLVNNAGIGGGPSGDDIRSESRDGHELRFAVNYLAPFLLTRELLPLLNKSESARIVNVASGTQAPINFDDVMLERDYSGVRAYGQSKLAQIMFTLTLVERLKGTSITANALHPASRMDTKIVFESFGSNTNTVQQGADATEWLAVSEEVEGVSGRYFDGQSETQPNAQAYERDARERLWTLSEELTGLEHWGAGCAHSGSRARSTAVC